MNHEDIAKRCAESIMQRANDTYPRTLHKDMLVDEIGKAISEATKRSGWPPAVALGDLAGALLQAPLPRARLDKNLSESASAWVSSYYENPE
ncbi:hypothetical protein [Aquamicrobium sp.]|uniref:hypothetical protein n=1 Tax=Aquamicrobium sp. TaxID=1872579 RepID=UPI00258DB625|nr:hypothetical protein [Aquamicrobium sp.]MCK9549205.1 hypothetical protein [Aquamicrobium sp.]